MRQQNYEYDAFISHAVEDKIPIANELCARLEQAGLRIWYSGKELGVGDSIEKTIEKGLNRSRYGIVIFSPTYLAKNWTIREFYTLLAKEIEEHKVILPVLYNITLDDLKNKDLVMADRFAVNAEKGIDFVVDRLVKEIRKSETRRPASRLKEVWFSKMWLLFALSLVANVAFLVNALFSGHTPEPAPHRAVPAATHPASQLNVAGIFQQMRGALNQANTCQCEEPAVKSRIPVRQASFETGAAPAPPFGDAPANGHHNKVTMAIVFQLESVPASAPEAHNSVDKMLQTIAMDERPQPWEEIPPAYSVEKTSRAGCLHHLTSVGE